MINSEIQDYFKKGYEHLKKNELDLASSYMEKAYKLDKNDPTVMSYYGLCTALRWGKIGLGLELCTRAIKRDFHTAIYYENLARVYMAANNKRGAITIVKKGARYAPNDVGLHELMIELGIRKRQIIPFLPRGNVLNRWLGTFFRRTLPEMRKKKKPPTGGGQPKA